MSGSPAGRCSRRAARSVVRGPGRAGSAGSATGEPPRLPSARVARAGRRAGASGDGRPKLELPAGADGAGAAPARRPRSAGSRQSDRPAPGRRACGPCVAAYDQLLLAAAAESLGVDDPRAACRRCPSVGAARARGRARRPPATTGEPSRPVGRHPACVTSAHPATPGVWSVTPVAPRDTGSARLAAWLVSSPRSAWSDSAPWVPASWRCSPATASTSSPSRSTDEAVEQGSGRPGSTRPTARSTAAS